MLALWTSLTPKLHFTCALGWLTNRLCRASFRTRDHIHSSDSKPTRLHYGFQSQSGISNAQFKADDVIGSQSLRSDTSNPLQGIELCKRYQRACLGFEWLDVRRFSTFVKQHDCVLFDDVEVKARQRKRLCRDSTVRIFWIVAQIFQTVKQDGNEKFVPRNHVSLVHMNPIRPDFHSAV